MTQQALETTQSFIPTTWSSKGVKKAWEGAKPLVIPAQPKLVQFHTWDASPVLDNARSELPNTKFVYGFGVDGVAKKVATGVWSVEEGLKTLLALYYRAKSQGFVAVVWNAEGAWKHPPSTVERGRLLDLLKALWEALQPVEGPEHWHTAYDHPASHSSYLWEAWLGILSLVVMSFAQVYAGAGETVMAHKGKLAAREVSSLASWQEAIKKGWVDTKNCSWGPYYQLHHVPAYATIKQALTHNGPTCLWAVPTRVDTEGMLAFKTLAAIELAGGLVEWQKKNGLEPDGKFGPSCARVAGVEVPRA